MGFTPKNQNPLILTKLGFLKNWVFSMLTIAHLNQFVLGSKFISADLQLKTKFVKLTLLSQ